MALDSSVAMLLQNDNGEAQLTLALDESGRRVCGGPAPHPQFLRLAAQDDKERGPHEPSGCLKRQVTPSGPSSTATPI